MNFHLTKDFEYLKPEIVKAISDFNTYEADFDTGKRNSVKKIELSDRIAIFKSFKRPNIINQIAYKYFRKSKAKRSFEYANKLLSLGIKTPPPIAYIEDLTFVGLQQSYYISEFLEYDLTYRELIHQPDYPNHEVILRAFTKFTFNLHEKGVLFLDHSPGNTLIKIKDKGYDFFLVDLNRMKFKELSFDERIQNFARLTSKKQMIEIMADEYAKLFHKSFQEVYETMLHYNKMFWVKRERKKRLKKKFIK
jgi:hypothetical protein